MVNELEKKYNTKIRTAINNNNPYTQVLDLKPQKTEYKPTVNPYNQQTEQKLKPLPKVDFEPLNKLVKSGQEQIKYLGDVGTQAGRQTLRTLQNIPSSITYTQAKLPTTEGYTQENKPFYLQQTELDTQRYKSVKDSMESQYDYANMPETTKKAYEEVVNTLLTRETYGKSFDEQRQTVQSLYEGKEIPDFVQKKLANIDSKETEQVLKVENARQNLVKMSMENANEVRTIQEKYADKGILEGTKFSGEILGSIIQMSPYIAASALGGLGGTVLSTVAGTGTMYAQVYTDSMAKAINEGATREEATQYAHASAMIEAGTEMLSGGIPGAPKGLLSSGIQGKIDDVVKVMVKDGTFRKFISTGVDVFGEGAEEALAEYLGSMALSIYTEDERSDEELTQDMIKAFIMGSVTSATMQMGKYGIIKGAEKFVAEKSTDVQNISLEQANDVMNRIALRTQVENFDGLSYKLEDLPKGNNGYIIDGKTIVLNRNQVEESGLIESALPHEMTHALEKVKGYDQLASFVVNLKAKTLGMDLAQLQQVYQEKFDEVHQQAIEMGDTSHQLEIATPDKMARELVAEFIKDNIASRPYKDAQGNIQYDSDGNIITYRNYDALLRLASNQPNMVNKIKKVIRSMIRKSQISEALEFDQTQKADFLIMQEYLESLDGYLNTVLDNADKGLFATEQAQGLQFDTKVLSPNTEQGVKVIRAYESENEQYKGTLEDAQKLLDYSARKGLGFNEVQYEGGTLVRQNNVQLSLDQLKKNDIDANEVKNVTVEQQENKSDKYVSMTKDDLWKEHYRVVDEMNAIKGNMFSKEAREAREPFNEELARISFAMQGKNYDDMFNSYNEYIDYISKERETAKQEITVKEQKRRQEEIDRINNLVKMNKKDILMSDEDIELFIEENDLNTTKDVNQAIFIFGNGTMINGDFSGGTRGADHQVLSNLFEYTNNYPKIEGVSLWGNIHLQTGVVRIVPETNVALIMEGQELTKEQESILSNSSYKVEEYLPLVQDEILVNKPKKQYFLDNSLVSQLNLSTLIPLIEQSKQSASDYINSLNIQSDNPNVIKYLETMSNFVRDYNPDLRYDTIGNLTTQAQEDDFNLRENGKLKVYYYDENAINDNAISYGHFLTDNPIGLENPKQVYVKANLVDANGAELSQLDELYEDMTNSDILKQYGSEELLNRVKSELGIDGLRFDGSVMVFSEEQFKDTKIKTEYSENALKDIQSLTFKKSGNNYLIRTTHFNGAEQTLVYDYDGVLSSLGNDFAKVILGNATTQEQSYDVVENILAKPFNKVKQGVFSTVRDDHNNQLTETQDAYFKDSKIRQKDGNLKVMYHGTEADFDEFGYSTVGKNGKAYGYGFYFTDDYMAARSFGGKVIESYLNITNPIDEYRKTFDEETVKNLISRFYDQVDYEYTGIRDSKQDEIERLYQTRYKDYTDMGVINSLIQDTFIETEQGLRIANEITGIDGYIVDKGENYGVVYVAFFPEQIKSINNPNPTTDRRIQYSIELDSVKQQQIEQAKLNSTNNFSDARSILNDGTLTTSDSVPLESVLINPLYNQAIINKMPTKAQKEQLQAFYLDTLARSGDTVYLELHDNDRVAYLKYPVVSDLDVVNSDIAKFYNANQQQEFFRESKARDEQGNLENVYHGTDNQNFFQFDDRDRYIFLSTNKEFARDVANQRMEENDTQGLGRIINAYVNVTKPFDPSNENDLSLFKDFMNEKYKEFEDEGEIFADIELKNGEVVRYRDYFDEMVDGIGLDNWKYLEIDDVYEFVKQNGYDGLVLYEDETKNYAVLNSNQIKETTNLAPTLSPDIRYSIEDERIATRSFQESVLRTELSDKTSETIEKKIADGTFNYVVVEDRQSVDRAIAEIGEDVDLAYEKIKSKFDSGLRMGKDDLVRAQLILKKLEKSRQTEKVVGLIQDISILATELGQQIQALHLVKRMSAEGQLVTAQKTITRLQEAVNKSRGKNKPFVKLEIPKEYQEFFVEVGARTQELEEQRVQLDNLNQELASSENSDRIKELESQIAKLEEQIKSNEDFTSQKNIGKKFDSLKGDIAKQLPVTASERLHAFLYMNMLGTFKTIFKNVLGNISMMPMTFGRDVLSVALQKFLPEEQRTRVLFASEESKQIAKDDYKNVVKDLLSGSDKYDMKTDIERKKVLFTGIFSPLEWYRNIIYKALQVTDDYFVEKHYVWQMSKYLTAQKLDVNTMTDEQLENARQFAIKEAKKATFKQTSDLANALNRLAKKNEVAGLAVQSTAPFKLTPINLVKTGVEYSPVGLLNGIRQQMFSIKSGRVTAAQAIDTLSAGLTGTGIALLGATMYGLGWIEISSDDDETKRLYNYKNSLGRQRYSVRIGDGSYSIDWIAPAIMPFIMGAEMARVFEEDKDASLLDALYEGTLDIMDPIFELTMLQGVGEVLQSFSGNATEQFAQTIVTMGENFANQFIPALLGQIAKTVDPIQRSSMPDAKGSISSDLERIVRKMGNKIPYVSMMNAPVVDVKGKPISSDENLFMRAFMNFVSPGWYKTDNTTEIDEEILRLYELTENTNVLPKATPTYFTRTEYIDGEKQTVTYQFGNKEYSQFGQTMGKESYELLGKLTRYDLDDDTKVKVMSKIYEYAYELAKDEYLKNKGIENENSGNKEAIEAELKGIPTLDYLIAKTAFSTMSGEDKKETFQKFLDENGFDNDLMEIVGGYKPSSSRLKTKGLKKLK